MSLVTTDNPPEAEANTTPVHTLSVFVNNKAGVLMRICQVFARRGYNIDSLVVSRGRDKYFSRMTIGISGDPAGLEQIILQVSKLIDVIHCVEHTSSDSVNKELLLVKFLVEKKDRTEALQIIDHYGATCLSILVHASTTASSAKPTSSVQTPRSSTSTSILLK